MSVTDASTTLEAQTALAEQLQVKHGGPGPHSTGTPQAIHASRWGKAVTTILPYDALVAGADGVLKGNERWDASDRIRRETAERLNRRMPLHQRRSLKLWLEQGGVKLPDAFSAPPADQEVGVVEAFLDHWQRNAYRGDSDPIIRDMRRAVDHVLGDAEGPVPPQIVADEGMPRPNPAMTLARVIYEDTQDFLKREGVEELTLFRGQGVAAPRDRSFESWSVDLGTASLFAGGDAAIDVDLSIGGGMPDAVPDDERRMLLADTVPARRVFSLPNTGIGQFTEGEVLVLPQTPAAKFDELTAALGDFGEVESLLDAKSAARLKASGRVIAPGFADRIRESMTDLWPTEDKTDQELVEILVDDSDAYARWGVASGDFVVQRRAQQLIMAATEVRDNKHGSFERFLAETVDLADALMAHDAEAMDVDPPAWREALERANPGTQASIIRLAAGADPAIAAKKDVMRKLGARLADTVSDEDLSGLADEVLDLDITVRHDGATTTPLAPHLDTGTDTWVIRGRSTRGTVRSRRVPAVVWVNDRGERTNPPSGLVPDDFEEAKQQYARGLLHADELRIADPDDPYTGPTRVEFNVDEAVNDYNERHSAILNDPEVDEWFLDDESAHRGMSELVAARLVSQWAQSSNDDNPLSLAIQEAAWSEFDLPNETADWTSSSDGTIEQAEEMYRNHERALRAFVRAQYDETQAWLRERGIERLELYRGFNFDRNRRPEWARQAMSAANTRVRVLPPDAVPERFGDGATAWMVSSGGGGGGDDFAIVKQANGPFTLVRTNGRDLDIDESGPSGKLYDELRAYRALVQRDDADGALNAADAASMASDLADRVAAAYGGSDAPVRVPLRPMSAFSANESTASDFSDGIHVIKVVVPASRVVGTPRSGVGCFNEDEFVLMGGLIDAELVPQEIPHG